MKAEDLEMKKEAVAEFLSDPNHVRMLKKTVASTIVEAATVYYGIKWLTANTAINRTAAARFVHLVIFGAKISRILHESAKRDLKK